MGVSTPGGVEFEDIFIRALGCLAVSDGELGENELKILQTTYQEISQKPLDLKSFGGNFEWAAKTPFAEKLEFFTAQKSAISVEHREIMLDMGLLMMIADKEIKTQELQTFHLVFGALGFSQEAIAAKIRKIIPEYGAAIKPNQSKTSVGDAYTASEKQKSVPNQRMKQSPPTTKKNISSKSNIRKARILVSSLFVIAILGLVGYRYHQFSQLRKEYVGSIEKVRQNIANNKQKMEAAHQERLNNDDITSGRIAQQFHKDEWSERNNKNPIYAQSKREKAIIEVAEISSDEKFSDVDVLEKVAKMIAPNKAKVKLIKMKGGYKIDLSFDMAEVTTGEHGARTKHHTIESLKREVVDIVSWVMKDMFEHCKSRSLSAVQVACQHGVKQSSFGSSTGPVKMQDIYKVKMGKKEARKIYDWKVVPAYQIAEAWTTVKNEFPKLRILTSNN